LDRHTCLRVDRLELFDELCQIFDGVDVVIVGGGNQVYTGAGMSRGGNLWGNLARRQVTALAGLCSLSHLDLDQVRGIDRFGRNTEAAGCDLNAAIEGILPEEVGDLAALAVDR